MDIQAFMSIMSEAPAILEAILAVVGGMKIISRYTPWKWDDKFFSACEAPVKKAAAFFPKKKVEPKDGE